MSFFGKSTLKKGWCLAANWKKEKRVASLSACKILSNKKRDFNAGVKYVQVKNYYACSKCQEWSNLMFLDSPRQNFMRKEEVETDVGGPQTAGAAEWVPSCSYLVFTHPRKKKERRIYGGNLFREGGDFWPTLFSFTWHLSLSSTAIIIIIIHPKSFFLPLHLRQKQQSK